MKFGDRSSVEPDPSNYSPAPRPHHFGRRSGGILGRPVMLAYSGAGKARAPLRDRDDDSLPSVPERRGERFDQPQRRELAASIHGANDHWPSAESGRDVVLGLEVNEWRSEMKVLYGLLYLISITVACVAGVSMLGHLRHRVWLYSWYAGDVGMALPTATMLLLVGAAIFILAYLVSHLTGK